MKECCVVRRKGKRNKTEKRRHSRLFEGLELLAHYQVVS